MLVFRTQFPVNQKKTTQDFFDLVKQWLMGSPHFPLQDDLSKLSIPRDYEIKDSKGRFQFKTYYIKSEEDCNLFGVEYRNIDNNSVTWITHIVYKKATDYDWFSLEVEREAESGTIEQTLYQGKKPYLIKLMTEFVKDIRGESIETYPKAHILLENQVGYFADLITGKRESSLPFVYLSRDSNSIIPVFPDELAKDLFCMAHVFVEPSTGFSDKVRNIVGTNDVCSGSVGIYWSRGLEANIPYSSVKDICQRIYSQVRDALLIKRLLHDCSWDYIERINNKNQQNRMKSEVNERMQNLSFDFNKQSYEKDKKISELENDMESYIDTFDRELRDRDKQIEELKKENHALEQRLQNILQRQRGDGVGVGVLKIGAESDLYEDEIAVFLMRLIRKEFEISTEGSRKYAVLKSLLDANSSLAEKSRRQEAAEEEFQREIKTADDTDICSTLIKFGFTQKESGKHMKFCFHDERYGITVAKTPSDHRESKNLYSKIKNCCLLIPGK